MSLNHKNKILTLLLMLVMNQVFGQASTATNTKINAVYWVVLVIFLGIIVTLVVLERKLSKLEKTVKQKETENKPK